MSILGTFPILWGLFLSVTIIDVAKKANVSKSTAGRVLAGELYGVSESSKRSVLSAAKDLGYVKNYLATSLRTTKSSTILLIIPDVANSFWSDVARGAQDVLDSYGYSLVLANSDWKPEREMKYLEMARSMMVDAVLINTHNLALTQLKNLTCPVVVLGNRLNEIPYPLVGTDTYKAVQESLSYLVSRGHNRIAMVHPIGEEGGEGEYRIRYQAYKDFFIERGFPFDENLITYGPLTIETGKSMVGELLAMKERPTAILAGNDLVAIGFIRECEKRGLSVPKDFSVVGMDDIPSASMMSPPLTTVRKPRRQVGMTAARIALDMIAGKNVGKRTVLPVEFIPRDTVRSLA